MLFTVKTSKSIAVTAVDLEAAVLANQFGLMHVHDLKQTMEKKGVEFSRECRVFEVCQPLQAKRVLEANMGVSTALPCRISVYEEDGKTVLATLRPTQLLAMFDAPDLTGVASEVESTLLKIMREAAADAA